MLINYIMVFLALVILTISGTQVWEILEYPKLDTATKLKNSLPFLPEILLSILIIFTC